MSNNIIQLFHSFIEAVKYVLSETFKPEHLITLQDRAFSIGYDAGYRKGFEKAITEQAEKVIGDLRDKVILSKQIIKDIPAFIDYETGEANGITREYSFKEAAILIRLSPTQPSFLEYIPTGTAAKTYKHQE